MEKVFSGPYEILSDLFSESRSSKNIGRFSIREMVILLLYCLYQDSGLPSSLVPLKAKQDDGVGPTDVDPLKERGFRSEDFPPAQGEQDDEENAYRLSRALQTHFYLSDGVLRPREHSNAILLQCRGQII